MGKKLTYEFVRTSFEQEGYTLLSADYVNSKIKLEFICPNGHTHSIKWNYWQRGSRCGLCHVESIKPSFEQVKSSFEKEGYTLLSTEYINADSKLDFICPNDHRYNMVWRSWQHGHRCRLCRDDSRKLPFEQVKTSFESEGYILLSTEYKNSHAKLEVVCDKGHKHSITLSNWLQGVRCAICTKNKKLTIEFMREEFEKEGYTLLSTEYKNAHGKLNYICNNGHNGSIKWNNWQQGQRCWECFGNISPSYELVKGSFEKEGYTLLSTEYKNTKTKLKFVCSNGHIHSISWDGWQIGRRCFKCSFPGVNRLKIPLYDTYAPQLSYAEEVRPFYDDESRKLLEIKCTYCGKWFVPGVTAVRSRVNALEGKGAGESNLYCSQECKDACSTYGAILYPKGFISTEELPYTTNDLHVWSQEVLTRAEHKCEICGEPAEHAHHIIPKKLEPFLATDPENGLAVCVKCHFEHCHIDECSTGRLANKVCSLKNN